MSFILYYPVILECLIPGMPRAEFSLAFEDVQKMKNPQYIKLRASFC